MPRPCRTGRGVSSPYGVEPVDKNSLSFDRNVRSGILQIFKTSGLDLFSERVGRAVSAVVVSRAGEDPVVCFKVFESAKKVGENRSIADDKISGEGDQVDRFVLEGRFDFPQKLFILSRSIVDVRELGHLESVERGWPAGKLDLLAGDREEVGLDGRGPGSAWNANSKGSENGTTGDDFGAEFMGHNVTVNLS